MHDMAKIEVPVQFRVMLSPVYQAYLDTSEALARDDLALAREQLQPLLAAIETVNSAILDEHPQKIHQTQFLVDIHVHHQ